MYYVLSKGNHLHAFRPSIVFVVPRKLPILNDLDVSAPPLAISPLVLPVVDIAPEITYVPQSHFHTQTLNTPNLPIHMARPFLHAFSIFLLSFFIFIDPSWGQTKILGVELARKIVERAPVRPYSPVVFCEKDQNSDAPLPIINTATDRQVVFWNRVTSEIPTTFHHTWHKRTIDGWEPQAHVRLKVQKSSSFRIWSTKEIHPKLHLGEWMIVVSLDNDPKEVLCIARFIVEQSINTNPASQKR